MLDFSGFRTGANLPWVRYGCDFGANAWQPAGGLAARPDSDDLKRLFERLAHGRVTLIRWFLFADGRSGITFDGEAPTGLDSHLLDDVRVALDLASGAGVGLMFTLFDFHWCQPGRTEGGVQLGGRSRIFADTELRAALLENVLTPLFRAVGHHPNIAAWDVINEPEWVTGGIRTLHPWSRVRKHRMRRLISDVTDLAHDLTPHPVTVGSSSAQWLSLVKRLALDFYQVHWYDHIDGDHPPDASVVRMLDKPVMLGEFPSRQSQYSVEEFLSMAERAGYFAALPWSMLSTDDASCGGDELCRAIARHQSATKADQEASELLAKGETLLP